MLPSLSINDSPNGLTGDTEPIRNRTTQFADGVLMSDVSYGGFTKAGIAIGLAKPFMTSNGVRIIMATFCDHISTVVTSIAKK